MDFEDMKLVLSHHFPDYEIKEARDGDGKDSDYVVYIPKQSSPFCYASAKDKKVYQFNFGKSILKKWYKYDVQSFGEWADEYSRETSVSLRYKWINERIEVFRSTLEMMIRGKISLDTHSVTFSQDSYQYRNNAKEYRLIYFGEVKDWAFRDGLGGASDKSSAWEQYIKIGDTPGTLRAKIDKDE